MVRSGYSNQLKREVLGDDVASAQGMTEIHKHSSCIGFINLFICLRDLCSCFGPRSAFCLSCTVSGLRRFSLYLVPRGRCYSLQHLFHCIRYILLEFSGMRRFWHYLLPHSRCFSLQRLFHCIKCICSSFEFPGMRSFWHYIFTSWPMFFYCNVYFIV